MKLIKQKVNEFFKKYGMDADSIDLDRNCAIFMEEMNRGLADNGGEGGQGGGLNGGQDGSPNGSSNDASSLLMIPTYIEMEKELPVNEPVIAIDAGGTNFRVAVIHIDESKKIIIDDFKLWPMPGTKGEIGKEEFFDTMASYIEPVINRSYKISFCFSYPAQILPNRDGRLIKFSKEVKVRDVEGELIGRNLLDALKKRGCTGEKSIIILNDTVATLLAGKAASPGRIFDGYIGFILGTGTNICYAEECKKIAKVPELKEKEGSMLINAESGAYNKVPRGRIDIEFDSTTTNPGDFVFEKTISGAYQGGLLMSVLQKAAAEGIISAGTAAKLAGISELASRDIDEFLYYPYGSNVLASCISSSGHDDDRIALYYIIDGLLERAARFIAFSLTAVLEKTGNGKNPCKPACITADGTTFYKSKLLRGKLDHYIKTYTNERKGIYCEFVKVENGTLIGTAIAGLLN